MQSVLPPQNFALEIRFGRYLPNVDDNVAGEPFHDFFGNSNRYSFGFEFDWQALRIPGFGTLGPAFGFGYTRMTGKNQIPVGEPPANIDQESSLGIMPMYLAGVLRVDVLMRALHLESEPGSSPA